MAQNARYGSTKPDFQLNTDDIIGSKPRTFARHIWGKEAVSANDYSKLQNQYVPEIIPASKQQYNPLTGEPLHIEPGTSAASLLAAQKRESQRQLISQNASQANVNAPARLDSMLSHGYFAPRAVNATNAPNTADAQLDAALYQVQYQSLPPTTTNSGAQYAHQQFGSVRPNALGQGDPARENATSGAEDAQSARVPSRNYAARNDDAALHALSKSLSVAPPMASALPYADNIKDLGAIIGKKDYNIVGGFLQDRRVYTRVQPYNQFEERLKLQYLLSQQQRDQQNYAQQPDQANTSVEAIQEGDGAPRAAQNAPSSANVANQQKYYYVGGGGGATSSQSNLVAPNVANRYEEMRRTSQMQLRKIGQSMIVQGDPPATTVQQPLVPVTAAPLPSQGIEGVAGKLNSYAEHRTALLARRHALPSGVPVPAPTQQAPVPQGAVPQFVRIYGPKALKNLDNVRIY